MNPLVGEDVVGAMLLQKGKNLHYMRPIYCASRVKTVAERSLSEVELIMVSVVYACKSTFCLVPFFFSPAILSCPN